MKRRVHVRADMLRAAVIVGRIPKAAGRPAFGDFFKVKWFRGRPMMSFGAEFIGQIDDFLLIERVPRACHDQHNRRRSERSLNPTFGLLSVMRQWQDTNDWLAGHRVGGAPQRNRD